MSGDQPTHVVLSFGPFEADLQTQELKKQGVLLHLPGQSFQILTMLLQSPGQLVSREKLKQALWPTDTFVDFEKGTNAAINRLREALGDSAENPRYIETLPRRGYRLIVPVTGAAPPVEPLPAASALPMLNTGPRTLRFAFTALGALIVAYAMIVFWYTVVRPPTAPKVLRFNQLTNDGQTKGGPLATDGSRVYFGEVLPGPRNTALQVSVRGGEAVPLSVPLKQPYVLDLSSDGTELLIANAEGDGVSLWVQPVSGGSPRPIGTVRAIDASFTPDATSVIYGIANDVYSVNRDNPSPRKLLTAGGQPFGFRYAPDARRFRFTQYEDLVDAMNIMEAAADGTALHKLFGGCCGRWNSDGRFFIFQKMTNGRLDVWALQETTRFPWQKRQHNPIQLTTGPLGFEQPLPSKDGKQIFAIGSSHRAEVIRYDSHSSQFVPYLSGISAVGLEFSRDGQWVTYISFPEGTLWRSKSDGSERLQLTFLPMRASVPRWSPDNTQIAFSAYLPGTTTPNIYLISSKGGTPQQILPSEQSQMDPNWSPDGNSLVFGTFIENMPIYNIDLKSRKVSTVPGSTGFSYPRLSPDGKYIVATKTTSPSTMMIFDVAKQKWMETSYLEISYPSWSRDGKYIYFQVWHDSAYNFRQRIVRFHLSDYKIEDVVVDFKNVGRLTAGTPVEWFGLAPDDSPIFARDISTSEIYALEMDWP